MYSENSEQDDIPTQGKELRIIYGDVVGTKMVILSLKRLFLIISFDDYASLMKW
jgi:hypothetical protein